PDAAAEGRPPPGGAGRASGAGPLGLGAEDEAGPHRPRRGDYESRGRDQDQPAHPGARDRRRPVAGDRGRGPRREHGPPVDRLGTSPRASSASPASPTPGDSRKATRRPRSTTRSPPSRPSVAPPNSRSGSNRPNG